jgi:hypothetical protein
MQYRTATEGGPSTTAREAEGHALPPEYEGSAERPAFYVSLAVLLLVATSSVVMQEPAPCDLLFPPVLLLTLVTGHIISPLKLPAVFGVSIVAFALANYASVVAARD